MKLHLPSSLLRGVMAASAVVCVLTAGTAAGMTRHPDVPLLTYCDFGQNLGRFSVTQLNALQQHLAADGVRLSYTGGQPDQVLPHPMIDFRAQGDNGAFAAIGRNAIATVAHNGVQQPTFSGRHLGDAASVHYSGIEFRSSENDAFLLHPLCDFKITRLNKLITDVTPTAMAPARKFGDWDGKLMYRAGSGTQFLAVRGEDGTVKEELMQGPYHYITGGVAAAVEHGDANWISRPPRLSDDSMAWLSYTRWEPDMVSAAAPLPYANQEGDSGSPVWGWNEESERYELIGCTQGTNGKGNTYYTTAVGWAQNKLNSFDKHVIVPEGKVAVVTPATTPTGEVIADPKNTDKKTGEVPTARPVFGEVLLDGSSVAAYIGLPEGQQMWKPLNELKDADAWFAFDKSYMTEAATVPALFHNENLVFELSGKGNEIVAKGAVDMGIGYVQLSAAQPASVTLKGATEDSLFNHAGFIVDKGVEAHLALTNPADYMREIRKVGEGNLYIEGTGDNHIFLNVGGKGNTYLVRKGGFAAYNVLASNGARVVIADPGQIARSFTFGFGGGILELNKNSLTWDNAAPAEAPGFRIQANTQDALVTNIHGHATLTVVNPGEIFLGSFRDREGASLSVVYKGTGTWTLHSTRTALTHPVSGLTVASGSVVLSGTPTVHGMGSKDGRSAERLERADDWHYADATMNVTVQKDGAFRLGSHARLTGNLTVEQGGKAAVTAPFNKTLEYIEGGDTRERTALAEAYAGLQGGSISVAAGAEIAFEQEAGADKSFRFELPVKAAPGSTLIIGGAGNVAPIALTNKDNTYGDVVLRAGVKLADTKLTAGKVRIEMRPADTARKGDMLLPAGTQLIRRGDGAASAPIEKAYRTLKLAGSALQGVALKAQRLHLQCDGINGVDAYDAVVLTLGAAANTLSEDTPVIVTFGNGPEWTGYLRRNGASQEVIINLHDK
ncbi:MAG: hypothetical protein MJ051_08305 [Akkermansia sp.]|nr:hypothetical protein [Akkermansia sp.]